MASWCLHASAPRVRVRVRVRVRAKVRVRVRVRVRVFAPIFWSGEKDSSNGGQHCWAKGRGERLGLGLGLYFA